MNKNKELQSLLRALSRDRALAQTMLDMDYLDAAIVETKKEILYRNQILGALSLCDKDLAGRLSKTLE